MDCTKSSFGMGEMKPSLAFAAGYAKFSIDSAIMHLLDARHDAFADENSQKHSIDCAIADLRDAASILVFQGQPEGDVE